MKKLDNNQIICVACPKGCTLEIERSGDDILVTKQGCKRGVDYAIGEINDPRRMVASTVKIKGGIHPLLPVYTSEPFPKGQIMELLNLLRSTNISAPIQAGEKVLENVMDSGVDILASRNM